MTIGKVGVIGVGLMGSGIAEVAAKAGFRAIIREGDDEQIEAGLNRIRGSLDRAVSKHEPAEHAGR